MPKLIEQSFPDVEHVTLRQALEWVAFGKKPTTQVFEILHKGNYPECYNSFGESEEGIFEFGQEQIEKVNKAKKEIQLALQTEQLFCEIEFCSAIREIDWDSNIIYEAQHLEDGADGYRNIQISAASMYRAFPSYDLIAASTAKRTSPSTPEGRKKGLNEIRLEANEKWFKIRNILYYNRVTYIYSNCYIHEKGRYKGDYNFTAIAQDIFWNQLSLSDRKVFEAFIEENAKYSALDSGKKGKYNSLKDFIESNFPSTKFSPIKEISTDIKRYFENNPDKFQKSAE